MTTSSATDARTRKRGKAKAKSKAVLGRECESCFINDSEASQWSCSENLCYTCQRKTSKRGSVPGCPKCSRCGKVTKKPVGEDPLCVTCDEREWLALGYCKTYLVHPEDDRERVLWRRPSNKLPDAIVATPKEWRKMR